MEILRKNIKENSAKNSQKLFGKLDFSKLLKINPKVSIIRDFSVFN